MVDGSTVFEPKIMSEISADAGKTMAGIDTIIMTDARKNAVIFLKIGENFLVISCFPLSQNV